MAVRMLSVAVLLVAMSVLCAGDEDNVCEQVGSPTGTDQTVDIAIPRKGYCRHFCRCGQYKCELQACYIFQWFDPQSCSCKVFGRNCDWYESLTTITPETTTTTTPQTTTTATTQTKTTTTPQTKTTGSTWTLSTSLTSSTEASSTSASSTPASSTTVETTPSTELSSTTTTLCMTRPPVPGNPIPGEKPKTCPPLAVDLLIPHPEICEKFISCANGIGTVMTCPPPLRFVYHIQLCDWPHCEDCETLPNSTSSTPASSTLESSISTPSTQNPALPTEPSSSICMTQPPVTGKPIPSDKPKTCPPLVGDLFIPHPEICEKYIVCSYGTGTIVSCPPPLKFRYELQLCDWPQCSDCRTK